MKEMTLSEYLAKHGVGEMTLSEYLAQFPTYTMEELEEMEEDEI